MRDIDPNTFDYTLNVVARLTDVSDNETRVMVDETRSEVHVVVFDEVLASDHQVDLDAAYGRAVYTPARARQLAIALLNAADLAASN